MRRFFINKVENMRDIGGYSIGNDKIVKEGKIIRTNCVTNLEEAEIENLEQMGFNTVIDLRSDKEIEKKRGVFYKHPKFQYNHIKINGEGKIPERKEDVWLSYVEMLEGKEQIKEVFEVLQKSTGGVIYYCNAGKDRTGVVTACILKFLGVDNDDIIVDYLATGVFFKKSIEKFAEREKDKDIFPIINPNYDTMYKVLNYIDTEYGSIQNYLYDCGLSDETLKAIKKKYIESL